MPEVFWAYSRRDISHTIKLKLGYEQAKVVQEYQTLGLLLSQAFGGSKSEDKPVETKEQALLQFHSLFGR